MSSQDHPPLTVQAAPAYHQNALDLAVNWLIVTVSFVCLGIGIALFLWAVRKPRARYVNSMNVIAWLLIGLFPTLLIFSFFPESSAEGRVVGIGLSGAIAGFAAIFLLGSRAGGAAIERDQNIDQLLGEIERLRAEVAQAPAGGRRQLRPIREQRDLRYRLAGKRRRELVILTGELADVRGVDVWVSSENTNMQMARYYDRSISSLVRYLGAVKDEAGHPVEDVISDELASCMSKMNTLAVQPATVIGTGAGELLRTHGVTRVFHVAAVQGQVGVGYAPVGDMGACVTNALAKFDAEEGSHASILFPLLGTGTASGDSAIINQLFSAAAQYVRANPSTRLERIVFIARHYEDLYLCVDAAGSLEALTRLGGSAERLLEGDSVAAAH